MEYFLGIDIGTTAVKAIAFSARGMVLCEQSGAYAIAHPGPDRSEQDPEEIAEAVFVCVENILHHFRQLPPLLISFSSAMHSLLAVDGKGRPLSPCLIWADNRAAGIASRLQTENRAAGFYFKTGVPVHAMSPFCKLLWWKENDPGLLQRAYKFIGIKEFVFYKLFALYAVDSSVAAATGLMDISKIQWDADLLRETGVQKEQLSDIVSVREVFRSPKGFPQLKNTPFVIGGSDGAMANLGTPAKNDHALVVSIGTSCAARVIVSGPVTDKYMRTFCYHLKDQWYLIGGAGNNGAIVLQWLRENFFVAGEALPDFLALAAGVPPGSDGLVFLPYILGERAPLWNAHASAVLFGLSASHNRNQVIRAAMEGVAFCVYAIGRIVQAGREIREIFVTGGFARNELWVQILADIFQMPVRVSETVEQAAWGAVLLGMEAVQIEAVPEAIQWKTVFPDPDHQAIYQRQFEKFERLYRLLREEF